MGLKQGSRCGHGREQVEANTMVLASLEFARQRVLKSTIQTTKIRVKDCGTKTKDEDHGVIQTVLPATAVLASDHYTVLQMASFNGSETELSNDAI